MFRDATDEDLIRYGEIILFGGIGILTFVLMVWKDYEADWGMFGIVDPAAAAFVGNIIFYLVYVGSRSRFGRTSYMAAASNAHFPIVDQRCEVIPMAPVKVNNEDVVIYDDYALYYPGTSWPQLNTKRSCICASKSLVDDWYWCQIIKGALRCYVGAEHLNLPYELTTRMQKFRSRFLRWRFGGTVVWMTEHPDPWVARHVSEYSDILGPVGDAYVAENGKEYEWLVGGGIAMPYDLTKEEGLNREIHIIEDAIEDMRAAYAIITGKKIELEESNGR